MLYEHSDLGRLKSDSLRLDAFKRHLTGLDYANYAKRDGRENRTHRVDG